jgi:hypothetical protein
MQTDPAEFWLNAYFKIQAAGINDQRFWWEVFDRLPVIAVVKTIEAIEDRHKQQANDYNHTLSLLLPWYAEGNNKASKYLPYPPIRSGLDAKTATIIKRLLNEGKLNRQVAMIIAQMEIL